MSVENVRKLYPTLSEFDAMWRAQQGRDFYAIICETLGEDHEAYEELTGEMFVEGQNRYPHRDPNEVKRDKINSILRSLDWVISDSELKKDEERMKKAHSGMIVWLDLLRNNLREMGSRF